MIQPKNASKTALPRDAIQDTMAQIAPIHVPKNRAKPVVLEAPIVMEQTNM